MSLRVLVKFRLYIAGGAQNSVQAVDNLKAICRTHLAGGYEVEIIDVLLDPKRALIDGIFLTPTLVRLTPLPMLKIVGTLSQTQTVLQVLGLSTSAV